VRCGREGSVQAWVATTDLNTLVSALHLRIDDCLADRVRADGHWGRPTRDCSPWPVDQAGWPVTWALADLKLDVGLCVPAGGRPCALRNPLMPTRATLYRTRSRFDRLVRPSAPYGAQSAGSGSAGRDSPQPPGPGTCGHAPPQSSSGLTSSCSARRGIDLPLGVEHHAARLKMQKVLPRFQTPTC
jgi:hypothetical protein